MPSYWRNILYTPLFISKCSRVVESDVIHSYDFYQTGAFGDEKWRIQYIAPVRGHELTTRAELLKTELDHPRAKEEYYKVQIGPLEKYSNPVLSETWRRITFLYTTGEYLLKATTINDLIV